MERDPLNVVQKPVGYPTQLPLKQGLLGALRLN